MVIIVVVCCLIVNEQFVLLHFLLLQPNQTPPLSTRLSLCLHPQHPRQLSVSLSCDVRRTRSLEGVWFSCMRAVPIQLPFNLRRHSQYRAPPRQGASIGYYPPSNPVAGIAIISCSCFSCCFADRRRRKFVSKLYGYGNTVELILCRIRFHCQGEEQRCDGRCVL